MARSSWQDARRLWISDEADPCLRPALSQPALTEAGVVVGSSTQRPEELALFRPDGQVIDAREAAHHEPLLIEFPVLVTVGAVPVAGIVMPLVSEAHADTVAGAG